MADPEALTRAMNEFFMEWTVDDNAVKPACEALYARMASIPGAKLAVLSRPGISFSVRALAGADIVALLDIIDDEPEARWLSVCFDAARITDKENHGDVIPKGLQGKDAICFDLYADDPAMVAYLEERISEALGS